MWWRGRVECMGGGHGLSMAAADMSLELFTVCERGVDVTE